jgi:hypothetical protein
MSTEFTLETARWGLMAVGLLIGCIGWQLYLIWSAIEKIERKENTDD